MAIAKKKPSAKRTVKYAAKSHVNAKQTAPAGAASSWAKASASDWQKGASDWAKQSAKMYQLPFAQGDMGQAADTVKSATENMMKMSNEMLQQFFGQSAKASAAPSFDPAAFFQQFKQLPSVPNMPQFDAASAQEKLSSFARESSEQLSKASQSASRAAAESAQLSRENVEAVTEVCNVAVAVSKELVAELINYANKQFAQNVELSKQVLSCRTLNDMFDLSTRIMKTNLDAYFSESVKISEMVFQCATDVSEPLNERMTETTERLTKAMAA